MLNAKPILPIFNIKILFTFYIVGLSVTRPKRKIHRRPPVINTMFNALKS